MALFSSAILFTLHYPGQKISRGSSTAWLRAGLHRFPEWEIACDGCGHLWAPRKSHSASVWLPALEQGHELLEAGVGERGQCAGF